MKNQTISDKEQPSKYKVKLSGDGAKMTRLTDFVILSFSLLNMMKTPPSLQKVSVVSFVKSLSEYNYPNSTVPSQIKILRSVCF